MNLKSINPSDKDQHTHLHEENLHNHSLEDIQSMYFATSCDTHPNLVVCIDGEKREIIGSSCINPSVDDADIFISLDEGAPVFDWEQPWYESTGQRHIRLLIKDMSVPEDTDDFTACIEYISDKLKQGKKIHVGCAAGHGRTGLFLVALVQYNMGENLEQSAIDYVRENYCKKAVESTLQVLYLHYVFGVDIPESEKSAVAFFEKTFLEEVGVDIEDILQRDVDYDELYDVLESVENIVYRVNQNHKVQLLNKSKEAVFVQEPIGENNLGSDEVVLEKPQEIVNSFKPF